MTHRSSFARRSGKRLLTLIVATLAMVPMLQLPARAATTFTDGFESGNLSNWTVNSGMAAQQQQVFAGAWAARATSAGTAAYAWKQLSSNLSELYYDQRFKVMNQGSGDNVSVLRLRTNTSGAILTVFRMSNGRLRVANEVSGGNSTSSTTISTGAWHELQLHLLVNGPSSTIEVWLDGTKLTDVSKTDAYGTTAVGRVFIGDTATGRTFDVAYDNVVVSTTADFAAPTVPTGLTATASQATRVDLSWAASTDNVGVTGYTIYRGGTAIATVGGATTSYADTTVSASTTYSYAVDAFDAAGNHSAKSTAASVTTPAGDTSAPSVPANLSATAVNSGRVDLTWNASTDNVGVTGYTIYRDGSDIANVGGSITTYSDTTVSPSTTYSYRVDAFDAAGNHSAKSTSASATTPAAPDTSPPTDPSDLAATPASSSEIDLAWTASTDDVGVTGYTIYRGGSPLTTVPGTATTYADTSVSPSTTYSYTVDAFDAAGNHSAQSTSASATTPAAPDTSPPTDPSDLAATPASSSEIDLAWTASTDDVGVTGYTIYRGGSPLTTVPGTATTYADTSVSPSTTYSYTVDAFDAAGNHSAQSTSASATTPGPSDTSPPSVPGNVTGSPVSSNRIDISWSSATDDTGVIGYSIYRGGTFLTTVGPEVVSYADTTVSPTTTYTYRVDAFDAAGNHSAPSSPVTVTTPAVPDTTPPSTPTNLATTAVTTAEVDISWTAATDNSAVTGYAVYRGGQLVANVGTTTAYADIDVNFSTTYTYTVDAFDAAGNHSPVSAPLVVTTAGVLFTDGFESGNLNTWSVKNGLVVQQQEVYAGAWAARGTSTGLATYAYDVLNPARPELYYDHRFKVVSSAANNVSLVRFLTSTGGAIATFMRNSNGRVIYWNQVTGVSTTSATSISTGVWHELKVHLVINGTSSLDEVWLDGIKLTDVSKTDNLGTTSIGRVLLGDPATGHTYDIAFDNVVITVSADVTPPTAPTGLTASAVWGNHVNLTWSPATDNVAVDGYTIYRGGSKIGTVNGTTTAWADFGATPSTQYTYTVDAIDPAGNHSVQSAPATTTTPGPSSGDPTIMAVGDIACDPLSSSFNGGAGTSTECRQKYTSDLAYYGNPSAVLVLGDNQYDFGKLDAFQQSFDTSWGRVRSIIKPVPGNHEYQTGSAFGYYSYFGTAAGDPTKGYYSYNIGTWHIIALNSECTYIGGCGPGSPEESWLAADLASHSNSCTLAYWHKARWSSGVNGDYADYDAFWQDLYNGGADVVLDGHDHDYERFAPQNPSGQLDANGIREFVVGTGGRNHEAFLGVDPNSEVRNGDTFGALSLTLHPNSYDWTFLPESGGTFSDSGTTTCH